MKNIAPKISVTPCVKKNELEEQIRKEIEVLYSSTVSLAKKEVAAKNYRHLVNHYHSLFSTLPIHLEPATVVLD